VNWSKRLWVVLAVSIGLNLTLIGMMVGARFHGRGHRPHDFDHGGRFPAAFDGAMRGQRPALAAHRGAAASARAEAEALLAKEPLDRAALEAALARLRRESQGSQEIVHRALVEAAAGAPLERRVELGRVLAHRRGMGRRGDGFRGPPPDPSAD
jgi:uncharacterized membrane protein